MKVHVIVPATTANLGPGFDALGLALNLWNEADFVATDDNKITLTVSGEGEGKLPVAGVINLFQYRLEFLWK